MLTDDFYIPELDILDHWTLANLEMEVFRSFREYHAKPMEKWTTKDVQEFIREEIQCGIEFGDIGEQHRFQCISGYIFRNLTEDQCKILADTEKLGKRIYDMKETYVKCHTELTPVEINGGVQVESGEDSDDELEIAKKPGRPRSKPDKLGQRSEKLWEFLMHLLQDSSTCPHLIKWENFEEGMFRFVRSEDVARLWGSRKKNENMTYEKFSRAMRYYYKSQVLLPVPGKRLVYKFGPQAKGWRNMEPIN